MVHLLLIPARHHNLAVELNHSQQAGLQEQILVPPATMVMVIQHLADNETVLPVI
jgi:hypothetical protein